MKKLFGIIFVLVFSFLPVNAETTTDWNTENGLARVEKIGKNLLSKNGLPTQVKFTVMETEEVNAFASGENEICVYTGLLKYVNDDAELAGVIAHEMGHILNNHVAKQSIISSITSHLINRSNVNSKVKTGAYIANQLSMLKMSRTQEYEADITGVDLMNNAGYNPLAMISFLYKISGNYIDVLQTHPSGDKRTMYSYNYITYNYPAKAVLGYSTDSFKQFMTYATPIVVARAADTKKRTKFNQEQEELKQERIEKMQKYQQENINGWSASYNFLKALSTAE
ncbi:MAG: M48 family metallopeptidase [Candidatus Gastranaerophilales bacterium]|nr:M48 family metallopeptidase [Candidatus Gastranaerophilales bacterium]